MTTPGPEVATAASHRRVDRPAAERPTADLHRPLDAADDRAALAAACAGAVAYAASGAWRSTVPGAAAPLAQGALVVALAAIVLGLASPRVRRAARAWCVGARADDAGTARSLMWRALALPAVLLALVVAWAAARGAAVGPYAAAFGVWLVVPAALVARGAPRPWPIALLLGAVLALWLPVELALLPPLPRVGAVGVASVKFVALAVALWLVCVVRPRDDVGYGLALRRTDLAPALLGFAAFAAVAIPVGFATGFLGWHPQRDPWLWLLRPALIFLTIAVPEELLFRGLLQRALEARLGARGGLAAAAAVFGLAHAPSPVYVALATLAGVAYGWVYRRSGRVAAAALTHALVDAVWVLLLRPPR